MDTEGHPVDAGDYGPFLLQKGARAASSANNAMARRTSGLTLSNHSRHRQPPPNVLNPYLFGRGPRFRWAGVFGVLAAMSVSAVRVADNQSARDPALFMETFRRRFQLGPDDAKTPQRAKSLRGFC